jgi:hypothetical protein
MLFVFLLLQYNAAVAQWVSAGTVTNVGLYPSISVVDQNTAWISGGPNNVPVIYRTTNGGTTWAAIGTTGLQLEVYCVWAANATTAFVGNGGVAGGAGGNAKFFRTFDGGTTWSLIDSTGTGTLGFFNGIVFSKTNTEFGIAESDPPAGTGQPFYVGKTIDGGITWTRTNPPGVAGNASASNSIFVIDRNFYGFGLNSAAQVYMTTDGGTTWNARALGLSGTFVSGTAFSDNKLNGIAVTSASLPSIARTTNGGVTWSVVNVGTGITGYATAKWITGTNVCYLSGATAIKKSTDGGLTWSSMTTPAITGLNHMEFARIGTSVLGYAVSSTGAVIKLADAVSGVADSLYVSFSQGASPLASVTGVLFADQCDSVRIVNLVFTWGGSVPPYQVQPLNWKAGKNQNVEQNFPLPPTAPGFPKDAHAVYVIYPGGTPQSLDIDPLVPGKRYVLGPPCPTTGVGDQSSVPERVQLSQNFPNPFNPNTVITYALPSETHVSLVIYDMLGREVVRLVDNTRQRAGYYEMQWNGRDTRGVQMPSGTYFIRLEAQSYTETRKLLLLK